MLRRWCDTGPRRPRACRVQDDKLKVLADHCVTDHALLGADWVGPSIVVGSRRIL